MYLNAHTCFSLNYGIMSTEELLQYARENSVQTCALTDINNTSACIDFMRLAPQYGIHPVVGIDFRQDDEQRFIGLAINENGFRELNEYLTIFRINSECAIPHQAPEFQDVYVIYPWQKSTKRRLRTNEYIGLRPEDVDAFRLHHTTEYLGQIVALPTVSFRGKRDFNTHRLLRAIAHNTLLSKLSPSACGRPDHRMDNKVYTQLYSEWPDIMERTISLLLACRLDFEFGKSKNRKSFTGCADEDHRLLEKLAKEGLQYRYENPSKQVLDRLQMELKTIMELHFTAYFLINWDIVRFASERGFFHIGRGSGANSLVAYCLRITDVDPVELDLYFERFINASRRSPPDFDIDFSHTDRDIVRQYIFDKYKGHVALVGSYNTFERKSCIREIGKVFGLPDDEISALQQLSSDPRKADSYGQLVLRYASLIHGMPNMLSVHACGIIISEKPISCYSALELMPVGFPSVQFSMLEAEDVGLNKYDILSQRGLGHIKEAVAWVRWNRGEEVDIHRIQDFKKDERIRQLLRSGDTIGCFYVESPAMRQLLRKLEVDDYLGLVAASSIIRPGVSSSGMMREYILRYRYPEKRKEAHPKLLEIMPETFGVMVYQEDVIKVAHFYAGLSLEEADIMRRGMSGKFRSRAEFQLVKDRYFENCRARNYPEAELAEIWRQIESFAGYSFAKGHSASYAVESYQSLFLRAYYPREFMTAVLNNFGGFYSTEFYLHEAKMLGADVELPCINRSDYLAVLNGSTIYMGFCLIKDVEKAGIERILDARKRGGPFLDLGDFTRRVDISLEQLRILIRIRAFRFTGKGCKELLWDAYLMLGKLRKTLPRKELFTPSSQSARLPALEYGAHEEALAEMEILGFPYTSPFHLLAKRYRVTASAASLPSQIGETVYALGYYVNIKRVTTISGQQMYFGCFTDSDGRLFDTVHFPDSIHRYPFSGKGCYLMKGKVVEDFGVPSIDVSHMKRVDWLFNPDGILSQKKG